MYRIVYKEKLAPGIWMMKIMAPLVARKAAPGQFIILRVDERGERIPLTIADYDRQEGWITIIFQEVGLTTRLLAGLDEGDNVLDFAGPLGRPSELDGFKRVLGIGGGVGVAPLYPQIKYLWENGCHVDVIIGARSRDYLILEKEMGAVCNNLYITTDDGSYVRKGFVSDVLKELLERGNRYDRVIAIGPLIMMKVVSQITREYDVPTTVSMNPVMVDGTGMCGGCRVTVGGEVRYACVDGPDFDGHLVDFDEAMRRQQMYREEEGHICRVMGMEGV
ncbi:MAG: sulfide/dihydroorotate dehydrogenase-like FAD/NAD-binding protein [Clostridiales bacterium]|jgi:ferredoxin--NADP+ reductase|nr:sulfide/dihydroorotate dehydrogenase-like FAD/NAD-binding protein [Clostridiales bacterium]